MFYKVIRGVLKKAGRKSLTAKDVDFGIES